MTGRRIAGWAALSVPLLAVATLSVLTGQLLEMAVGVVIAAVCILAVYGGLRLLGDGGQR